MADRKSSGSKLPNPNQLLIRPTYDPRFFEDSIGRAILGDPKIALIELIANAWDAGATKVSVNLPNTLFNSTFSIEDNGAGMTAEEFSNRWMRMSYNRIENQGIWADKPPTGGPQKQRKAFGRNGKGRHAGFCFTRHQFFVETKKNGKGLVYRIYRPGDHEKPFVADLVKEFDTSETGTRIYSDYAIDLDVESYEIRAAVGMRFLSFTDFDVTIDGHKIVFEDIPDTCFKRSEVLVKRVGFIDVITIDMHAADRTTKHHGIAWHVAGRLVGEANWKTFGDQKFIDGRSAVAKRFSFIIQADCLDQPNFILPDWTGFNLNEEPVKAALAEVNDYIRKILLEQSHEEREKTYKDIEEKNAGYLNRMGPIKADSWKKFVTRVQEDCPSLSDRELESVATILAKLEVAESKYSLLQKMETCSSENFDSLNELSDSWTVETAKIILDELRNRLHLIQELEKRILDPKTDELHDLQPIFDRALWIFGPEFESIEFTSNRTMASVIRKLLKLEENEGSARRPDYVVLTDGSVGFYSRPSWDETHEADKVANLAIVELKKPTVMLGRDERNQCEDYYAELQAKGQVTSTTKVTCFLLGTTIKPFEGNETKVGNSFVLRPMTYDTVIRRAKARTLYLFDKVKAAPFLDGEEIDEFLNPSPNLQMTLLESEKVFDMTPPTGLVAESPGMHDSNEQ